MQQPVAESIGGAQNEIEETKPTLLPATGKVEEAEASTGRQQILPSDTMSTDFEEICNLLKLNRLGDVDELQEVLKVIEKGIQEAYEEAQLKKVNKKWWGKRVKKEQSELMSKVIIASTNDTDKVEKAIKGDSKLLCKVTGIVNDTEIMLQKFSEIGYKPSLTSGNMVARESYTLLQQCLSGIGNVHYAAVALSMVAYVLERVNLVSDNSGNCLALLESMLELGKCMVKAYPFLPEDSDLLQKVLIATIKGVSFCCKYTKSGALIRFGLATVNKEQFDALSKKMKELSEQFTNASLVALLKSMERTEMSVQVVQVSQTSLSNQVTEWSKQVPTILPSTPVAPLEGETSLSKNMTQCELRENPIMDSFEREHNTNTGYGLPEVSAQETEYSNLVVADSCSVSKLEKARIENKTSVGGARPQNFQRLPQHMTDMHGEEEKILSKLESVTTLGLVGMGGLGKTTRAKAIFNILGPKFDYTCFVSDVKLIKGREDDVKEELWKCLHFQGKKVGGERNLSILRGKQLLLALDDVSDRDINVLLDLAEDTDPASRFIWTSREHDILKDVGAIHEVHFMAENHAKLLFMKHAFPEPTMLDVELEILVEDVVRKCDGLPLALEVVGKYLRGKEKHEVWKDTLSVLQRAEKVKNLNDRLSAKLRLSFDSLGEKEQEIFLDATNFFCESWVWTLGKAKLAWRAAYGEVSELLWQTLVDTSLVYDVGEDDYIKVHEQLRSVGRMIASEPEHNGKYQVWMCNRNGEVELLGTSDASHGKEVRALQVHHENGVIQVQSSRMAFQNTKKLRFLEMNDDIQIVGATDDTSLPTQLVLLSCHGQVLFNPALQKDLVGLKLWGMEDVPTSIGQLSKLGHLEIKLNGARCHSLPRSFGQLSALRHLRLGSCEGLQSLPESFGQLSALRHLTFCECPDLESLPESFGQLSALRQLQFYGCRSLGSLCESFGQLRALEHLEFERCDLLGRLPESFGQLSALTRLQFRHCPSLKLLPQSFGQVSSLEHLSFASCDIQSLPESFGLLSALTRLFFSSCPIKSLPENFGQLSSLERLQFRHCPSLNLLPQSFGQVSSLEHLSFAFCDIQSLPESFGLLSALTRLYFSSCPIKSLPENFGQLSSLERLSVLSCPIESLPESFGQLSALTSLVFAPSPFSHTCSWTLPNISTLMNLRYLQLWDYSVTTIPDCVRSLKSLRCVEIIRAKPIVDWPEWLVPSQNVEVSYHRGLENIYQIFHVHDGILFLIEEGPGMNYYSQDLDGFFHANNLKTDISKLLDL